MVYDSNNHIYKYKANLHFHSKLSDGIYSLKELLKLINDSEFDIISLTDHNEIKNSVNLFNTEIKEKIIILGIEISTSDLIEILVYFKDKNEFLDFFENHIKTRKKQFWSAYIKINIFELLDEIKNYNILLGVPHPFGGKGLIRRLYKKGVSESDILKILQNFDFCEVFNSTKSKKNNYKAKEWCELNSPNIFKLASSDLHNIKSSFCMAGTNVFSSHKLNLDNFFSLVKSKKHNDIVFWPYGKSLRRIQIYYHHVRSFVRF